MQQQAIAEAEVKKKAQEKADKAVEKAHKAAEREGRARLALASPEDPPRRDEA